MSAADSRLYPGNAALRQDDADAPERLLRAWAKAYRDKPEYRFPSDPDAEFFPIDMESAANEIERLRSVAQGSQEGTPSAAGVWFSSLIESLRPFAYYFDLNDCEGRSDGDALEIPVSDLRAARDLLKKLGIDTSLPPWAPSLCAPSGDREYDPNVAPCDDAEFGMKP